MRERERERERERKATPRGQKGTAVLCKNFGRGSKIHFFFFKKKKIDQQDKQTQEKIGI